MTVYMLKDLDTGLYYLRTASFNKKWVEQEKASIWPSTGGPTAAKGSRYAQGKNLKIEAFRLTPVPDVS